MLYTLTNEQRKYLGLTQIGDAWDEVIWGKAKYNKTIVLYFDGDKLVKKITVSEKTYHEMEIAELTAENRTIVLPKTAKGKPKKLNYTALQAMNGVGVYFAFGYGYGGVMIANYTTQTTFYSSYNTSYIRHSGKMEGFEDLDKWLNWWIQDTTEDDLKELERFKSAKRQNCKYKAGDFFAFKTDRREYGFGRILLDVHKFRKEVKAGRIKGNHYGLTHLMGRALIIKIYKKTSDSTHVNLTELKECDAFLSEPIMDNVFFYGEHEILGNLPLEPHELDFPISYSRSIDARNPDMVYLQYGLIYLETDVSKFNKYLWDPEKDVHYAQNPFRCEGIGFNITSRFPNPYKSASDLRSPENIEIKREIFTHFGLDADKSYYENYERYFDYYIKS